MYNFLTKNGQRVAFGLGLVIAVLFFLIVTGGIEGFNALPEEQQGTTTIFNFGLMAALALIVICGIAAVLFGILQTVTNPKDSLKGLLGIAVLALVFVIAYFTIRPEASASIAETLSEFSISDNTSKFISGSLWTALALGIIAAVAFVVSELINLFK